MGLGGSERTEDIHTEDVKILAQLRGLVETRQRTRHRSVRHVDQEGPHKQHTPPPTGQSMSATDIVQPPRSA